MPYVQRDSSGKITGLYANPQPQPDGTYLTQPEPLPEDHPDVVAFRSRVPPMPVRQETPEEIEARRQDHERLEREHKEINAAILGYQRQWSELDIALSALLYEILNVQPRASHLAYAVYYAPTSHGARIGMVDNALKQLVLEAPDKKLKPLTPLWAPIYKAIREAGEARNVLAHGSPVTLHVRGQKKVRLTSPAFDVIRVGRVILAGGDAGLSVETIRKHIAEVGRATHLVDCVNRLIAAYHAEPQALPERFRVLEANLKTPHSQS